MAARRTEEEVAFAAACRQRRQAVRPFDEVEYYRAVSTGEVYLLIKRGEETLMQRGYCRLGGVFGAGDAERYPLHEEDFRRHLRDGRFEKIT